MILLLFLFVIVVSSSSSSYPLVPLTTKGYSACNGSLSITNTLIGNELIFKLAMQPLSCTPAVLHVLMLSEKEEEVVHHKLPYAEREETRLLLSGKQCSERHKMIVLLSLNDTNLVAQSLNVFDDDDVLCNSSALYSTVGFNCNETPYLQPIDHSVSNCLVSNDDPVVSPQPGSRERHSPLCWYLQCLNGSLTSDATLCGEPVCALFYRSNLYLTSCGARFNMTVSMTPWNQMAVQLVTYVLNHGEDRAYRDVWWLVGMELLERHCGERQHPLSEVEMNEKKSFFRSFLAYMQHANEVEEVEGDPCDAIEEQFDNLYNKTMSEMLYNRWFYAFKFVLMPDKDMEKRAILLVTFLCSLPLILIALILYFIYETRPVQFSKIATSRLQ